jgi:hypothetical protein
MAFEWLARLIGGQSYKFVIIARDHLECASRLRQDGQAREALVAVREGLSVLRSPAVRRRGAAEGTLLVQLTTMAEELAQQLGERGADREDLVDTLSILSELQAVVERVPSIRKRQPALVSELSEKWIPYLRERVNASPSERLS